MSCKFHCCRLAYTQGPPATALSIHQRTQVYAPRTHTYTHNTTHIYYGACSSMRVTSYRSIMHLERSLRHLVAPHNLDQCFQRNPVSPRISFTSSPMASMNWLQSQNRVNTVQRDRLFGGVLLFETRIGIELVFSFFTSMTNRNRLVNFNYRVV